VLYSVQRRADSDCTECTLCCAVGTVTMWTPNTKEPQVKMLCHGAATRTVAVDFTGMYASSSTD